MTESITVDRRTLGVNKTGDVSLIACAYTRIKINAPGPRDLEDAVRLLGRHEVVQVECARVPRHRLEPVAEMRELGGLAGGLVAARGAGSVKGPRDFAQPADQPLLLGEDARGEDRRGDDDEEERACDEAGHREPRYAAIVTRHDLVGRHSQWRGIRGFRGGDENTNF